MTLVRIIRFLRLGLVALSSACISCAPAIGQKTYAPQSYQWVAPGYQNGRIVKVGDCKLPIPLVLPKGLQPLENKLFLMRIKNSSNATVFMLYFPISEENDVRNWAKSQPNRFPLPEGAYHFSAADHLHTVPPVPWQPWRYGIIAETRWGHVIFNWECDDLAAPANIRRGSDASTVVLYGRTGPIMGQKRLIHLDVIMMRDKVKKA